MSCCRLFYFTFFFFFNFVVVVVVVVLLLLLLFFFKQTVLDKSCPKCATQDAGCLAARTFRCHALLGIPSDLGSCEVPILGLLGSLGYISWSARIDGIYSGNGEPLPFQVPLCSATSADANAFLAIAGETSW